MRQFQRADRVGDEILKVISTTVAGEYTTELPGMVTFTRVKLSKDLRNATVFYSFLGETSQRVEVEAFLEREAKHLRHLVGQQMRLRHMPELLFKFDPSVEGGIRIEQLLNQIRSERSDVSE